MERDEVGPSDQVVEVDELDVIWRARSVGHERVVGDEPHPEREGALGDELADAAEADDAERLVGQLDAVPLGRAPSGRP